MHEDNYGDNLKNWLKKKKGVTVSNPLPTNRMAKNLDQVGMAGEVEKVSHQRQHLFQGDDRLVAEIAAEDETTRRRRRTWRKGTRTMPKSSLREVHPGPVSEEEFNVLTPPNLAPRMGRAGNKGRTVALEVTKGGYVLTRTPDASEDLEEIKVKEMKEHERPSRTVQEACICGCFKCGSPS